MNTFTTLTSLVVLLPINNIDTDQIIPARFMKVTDKSGLGVNLFSDWRYNADGSLVADFVLNRPEAQEARILLAGDNFGCGSSREHAPWALIAFGFRAVISTSFADIFRNNALKNGLLPVQVKAQEHQAMIEALRLEPQSLFSIDLNSQTITWAEGHSASFPVDPFARTCLLQGVDELGYLLSLQDSIDAYEAAVMQLAG